MSTLKFGMDFIIISITSSHEELFWQRRLDAMRGQVIKEKTLVLVVYEDWPNGAGNGLGSLYAFSKASQKAIRDFNIDLLEELHNGASLAIYHTAGKGTRLAPLTGSEYNSKSRVKLIGSLFERNTPTPITLLEAIIKQTSIFAPFRKGRVSVFWGDQLFIPENELQTTDHDIDLLIRQFPCIPNEKTWQANEYFKYGIVIKDKDGKIKQLEKLTYENFSNIPIRDSQKTGISFGSFSVSTRLLKDLLNEFAAEIESRKGQLDCDPHFWMPLSLNSEEYFKILKKQGTSLAFSKTHYERMNQFKEKFISKYQPRCLLGASDMGANSYWWDYGNGASYFFNSLKLVNSDEEAETMRAFFNIKLETQKPNLERDLSIENSCLINCSIKKGRIKNSVLNNVVASDVDIEDSVVINTSCPNLKLNESLLYNVVEDDPIEFESKQVRADCFSKENGHIKLKSSFQIQQPWDQCIEGNPFSFAHMYKLNQNINPNNSLQFTQLMHNRIKQTLVNQQMDEVS